MKALVVDGSAALGLILPDERQSPSACHLRSLLEAEPVLYVPTHWWVELANGLIMAERRKRITLAAGMEMLTLIQAFGVTTDDAPPAQTTAATAALARQQGLTAYDAAYLELAVRRGAALATQDKELLRAAEACGIERFA